MTVDRFLAEHRPTWARLAVLVRRAGRRPHRLRAEELDELVDLYQRTATHLSIARTNFRDPVLLAELTDLVAGSAAVVYGTRARTWRGAARFVGETVPAALWHLRREVLAAAALLLVPAVVVAVWLTTDVAALEALAPEEFRRTYVEEDFAAYYTENPSGFFAALVYTNNARIGIQAFALGIAAAIPTVLILALNGANVGVAAALFAAAGELGTFFSLLLPHGLLELTAVAIAGGTGLRLGWTLVDPGDRPRGASLAEEGRRAVAVVVALVGVFAVAGLIEGYVTASALPTVAELGIGVLAEVVVVGGALVLGRAASRRGRTGSIGEDDPAAWALGAGRAGLVE